MARPQNGGPRFEGRADRRGVTNERELIRAERQAALLEEFHVAVGDLEHPELASETGRLVVKAPQRVRRPP